MSMENTYVGSECLEIVPTLAYLGLRFVVQARCECGTNAWRGPSVTYLPPGFLLCCRTYMGYPQNYEPPSGYRLNYGTQYIQEYQNGTIIWNNPLIHETLDDSYITHI